MHTPATVADVVYFSASVFDSTDTNVGHGASALPVPTAYHRWMSPGSSGGDLLSGAV